MVPAEGGVGEPMGCVADDDGARRRKRLQASGEVRRLTEREMLVSSTASHLAHDDQAGVDPDTHGKPFVDVRPRAYVQSLDRLDALESRAHGPAPDDLL